jgi:hypothetical protein
LKLNTDSLLTKAIKTEPEGRRSQGRPKEEEVGDARRKKKSGTPEGKVR